MAATKTARRNGAASRPALPPISVAKFREALLLLDRVVQENTATFIEHGQSYRDQHRDATSRPLAAEEVAAIAAGLGTSLADARTQIDDAGLTASSEPQPSEVLLAAGVATTPALLDAILRVTALIELDGDVFRQAREAGTLDETLDEAVRRLDYTDLVEQRERAAAAWERLSQDMGHSPGKAWGLIARTAWQAVSQAMSQLAPTLPSMSSIDSPAPTTGGDATSSMTPAGSTLSS